MTKEKLFAIFVELNIFCCIRTENNKYKIFYLFTLLFYLRMIKYTRKSVEESETKFAHHFPPYHIGNRLEIFDFGAVIVFAYQFYFFLA